MSSTISTCKTLCAVLLFWVFLVAGEQKGTNEKNYLLFHLHRKSAQLCAVLLIHVGAWPCLMDCASLEAAVRKLIRMDSSSTQLSQQPDTPDLKAPNSLSCWLCPTSLRSGMNCTLLWYTV